MGKKIRIAVTQRHIENKDGSFLSIEKSYLDFWPKYSLVDGLSETVDYFKKIKK